jgi:MFS family permease
MLWTEKLFQLIPIGKERGSFASFLAVRLIRSLCFTFIFFLIGFVAVLISGNKTIAQDPRGLASYGYFFMSIFLAFTVSGWFRNKWDWFFSWSSHILKLSDTEFGKFRDRMEKFNNNFLACLIIFLPFFISFLIYAVPLYIEDWGAIVVGYLAFVNFFMVLFFATLVWIVVSMWITLYVTLRQPLNLKLSPHTDEEFRPLAIWGLKVLFITFVLVTIVVIFYNLGIVISPWGFAGFVGSMIFIVFLGVLAFLLPFYHVHRVLVKLKKQELHEIEEEHDRIIQDLTGTTSTQSSDTEAHMMYLINSIISLEVLHIRERRAKDADDWPIDTTILSAMAGLVLIPILVNIVTNLI